MRTCGPVRHPILLSLWAALIVVSGLGLANPMWLVVVFLGTPIAAIATFSVVYARREVEELRPGWSIAYRIATAGLALAGVVGVIATAGSLSGPDAEWFARGPLALLFLVAFLSGWPAITKPSPRRAAIPAMIIHIAWVPLVIATAVVERHSPREQADWHRVAVGVSLVAVLALSAIVAILSIVSFHGERRIAAARASAAM